MGRNIGNFSCDAANFERFQQRLYQQLAQLKEVLSGQNFGQAPLKIGAEFELYLVNPQSEVSNASQILLDELGDEQFQHEINQYNLELNLTAVTQTGAPFSAMLAEILEKIARLEQIARKHQVNVVAVGILPTLKAEHLNMRYMTDLPRYRCMAKQLHQQRGKAFQININGEEPVSINFDDICAEGANTSFQVHLMTAPEKFTTIFNAAQLTLPLVCAIAANSSIFLGNRVWDETRIALFKQSIDIRSNDLMSWRRPTRVNFGHGWLRNSGWELYAQTVALHSPIIPALSPEFEGTGLPPLDELCLHMGSVWPWHRPVYSHHGNGHMRIEFRAIPAGPTNLDMLANAAFAIGLAVGLGDSSDDLVAFMPFQIAEYNFYRAAQYGLSANIVWPLHQHYHPVEVPIVEVINAMLPVARKGLQIMAVDAAEIDRFIGIIEQRLASGITGAVWQKQTQRALEKRMDKANACRQLVKLYLKNSQSGLPIAHWERIWQ